MIAIEEDDNGPEWVVESAHGRQDELNFLNTIAERKSSACVLLQGCNGSGKSTLMRAVNWEEKGWVFVAQNFERHLSMEPYSALARAIDELVEIWCANNQKSSETSEMSDLLELLEKDMDLLQNVIPGLFRVLYKYTQRTHLSRSQCMKSLKSISTRSIKDLTNPRLQREKLGNQKMGRDSAAISASVLRLFEFLSSVKPVVLSFDDVHYADSSSMDIIKRLAQNVRVDRLGQPYRVDKPFRVDRLSQTDFSTNHAKKTSSQVLVILSYTDLLERNRVAFKTIRKIRSFSNVHSLYLKHWDIDTVNQLVASLVKASPEESMPLSEVIYKKTGGNPFAVTQFLRFARENEHLIFSPLTLKWEWEDVEFLDQCFEISENVAKILASSMVDLSPATTDVLKAASCLGHVIPTDVLSTYFAMTSDEESKLSSDSIDGNFHEEEIVELLEGATKAGILVKSKTQGAYKWSHDLLQEATYESIPVPMRNTLHLKLGRLLWSMSMICNEEWMVFMAANQMNMYSELESESCSGNEIAELNLQAAYLSLNKGAIYPALDLLMKAERLMEGANRWDTSYDLTLSILTTLAETKLRVGETGTAFKLATEVVRYGRTHEDTFPAHIVMLECHVSGNDRNYDMGVERTLFLLKVYGEKHSWKFYRGQEAMVKARLKAEIKKVLPNGELESLLDSSKMVDKALLRIQTLLVNHLAVYASYSPKYKSLSWFASARALRSACMHGISPSTNLAVVQMATHLRVSGKYKEASKYADVAMMLTKGLPRKLGSNHGQVRMIACGSVFSAVRSFNNCLNELMECRTDFLRAGLAKESIGLAIGYTITHLCAGQSLAVAKSDLETHITNARHYGCPYSVEQRMRILEQTIVNLIEDVKEPTVLSGQVMNQDNELEKVEGLGALRTRLGMDACRLMLCCFFSDWDTAGTLIDDLEEFGDNEDGFFIRSHYQRCYVGLAAFVLGREEKDSKLRKKYLTIGKNMLKLLAKEMKYGSVNAYPIVAMLEAEQLPSKDRYDKAIKSAARLGLVHHEAYMCERAAEMFRADREVEWSKHYISEAILLYGEWGASGKVNQLYKDYTDVLSGTTRSALRESVNPSLQSRCRYSTEELNKLRAIDWRKSGNDDIDFSFRNANTLTALKTGSTNTLNTVKPGSSRSFMSATSWINL